MYASCAFVPGELRVSARELRVRVHESARSCPPTCGQLGPAGARRAGGVGRVRQGGRMTTSSPGSVPSGSLVLSPASLLAALLDLLLPGSCGGCAAPGTGWCAGCAAQLGPPLWPVLPGGLAVSAAGRYRGRLRSAVLEYKERGRRDLAGPLSSLLIPPLGQMAGAADVWLVPAPSRPSAARARGGDHVLRLCRHLARGDPGRSRRARAPAGQAGARLRRAGRRGSGRRTWRGASGWTPGPCRRRARRWSLSTMSSPPARR